MLVTKCDLCKKEIANDTDVEIRIGFPKKAKFCQDCAAPVIRFLQKHKFIKKNEKK